MEKRHSEKTAVIIPCYNEEVTIRQVVVAFKKELPDALIYVFDNNSSDNTGSVAREEGARVRRVGLQGKGNVVRRMFADVEADIYVMVDGDATYDAPSVHAMIRELVDNNHDMVVGCRTEESKENNNYRPGHRLGNKLLTGSVQRIFGGNFTDMLSGYRVFSKRFVKSFAAESAGFEIETELTVHLLEMRMSYGEVQTPYAERPDGSESKLSTYKDGIRILNMIIKLYSNERPKQFWGGIGLGLVLISVLLAVPIIIEFFETHTVPHFPTFILAVSLAICGFLSITAGVILRTVTKGRRELKHLVYLATPSVQDTPQNDA